MAVRFHWFHGQQNKLFSERRYFDREKKQWQTFRNVQTESEIALFARFHNEILPSMD